MDDKLIRLLISGTGETFYMVIAATLISYVFGMPLGILVYVTDKNGICKNTLLNKFAGMTINTVRSIPFLILLVAILPFTRAIVGTTIGSSASVVPLVVAATPFVARMVESALKEVEYGVVEAAQAMGSTSGQIILKVLIPEAGSSLLVGMTIAFTTILGYSAMAGFVGGGGLGAIAVNYGYYRYQTEVMLVTVALLVIIVQIFQEGGLKLAAAIDKRIKR